MRFESWIVFLLPFSQWAMQKKRGNVEHEGVGIDFGGFKCAETLCFFEQTAEKCVFLMGMFMDEVAEVGLVLNPNKPIVLQTKFHRQLF